MSYVFLTAFAKLSGVVFFGGLVGTIDDCKISFWVIELHNLD
jgi:hypothetical protein